MNANDNAGSVPGHAENAAVFFKARRAVADFRDSLLRFDPFQGAKTGSQRRLVLILQRDARVGASIFFLHCGELYSLTVFFGAQP